MNYPKIIDFITDWLANYASQSGLKGYVVGVSGGIDSAITSTLCAKTGLELVCCEMGIHQNVAEVNRGMEHIEWLENKYENVAHQRIDLTNTFETLKSALPTTAENHGLSMANTRARLRMTTLYAIGQANSLLVAGTGNKIEDFGVGFFTKYGDGGVDVSPIADLTKTDVFAIAEILGIVPSIQNAAPTDGLWDDERTDETQLGATYKELEWAMNFLEKNQSSENLTPREKEVLAIYKKFNSANKHKMVPVPVCVLPNALKR